MILVTGATGLLGSHVLVELSKTNQPICALYRDEKKLEKVERLFSFYFQADGKEKFKQISWRNCDIEDIVALEDAMTEIIGVYHCAAFVSFRRRDFPKMVQVNRRGTENLVNLALEKKMKFFCHVSSTAAIGKPENHPEKIVKESNKWEENKHTSGYALSKQLAEKEVWRGIEEGLNAVIVNPCVIFGAGDWDESSLTIFRTVQKGLRFYTPGSNAVVDARDVAKIMLELVQKDIKKERFLVIGTNIAFRELLNKIALRLGVKQATISTPRFVAACVWRLASLKSLFIGKSPTLTKESVQNAYSTTIYDKTKIDELLHYSFSSLEDTIDNVVRFREM